MPDGGSGKGKVISKAAVTFNGISIAYVMGFVNAVFACLLAFGITLTDAQIASVSALINAAMILAVHFGHRIGEATASGASGQTSRTRMEGVAIAAERRGLELHDAAHTEPAVTPAPEQG